MKLIMTQSPVADGRPIQSSPKLADFSLASSLGLNSHVCISGQGPHLSDEHLWGRLPGPVSCAPSLYQVLSHFLPASQPHLSQASPLDWATCCIPQRTKERGTCWAATLFRCVLCQSGEKAFLVPLVSHFAIGYLRYSSLHPVSLRSRNKISPFYLGTV